MSPPLSRRALLGHAAMAAAALGLPRSLSGWIMTDPDQARLAEWAATLRREAAAPTCRSARPRRGSVSWRSALPTSPTRWMRTSAGGA
jgi:hypothetical protein